MSESARIAVLTIVIATGGLGLLLLALGPAQHATLPMPESAGGAPDAGVEFVDLGTPFRIDPSNLTILRWHELPMEHQGVADRSSLFVARPDGGYFRLAIGFEDGVDGDLDRVLRAGGDRVLRVAVERELRSQAALVARNRLPAGALPTREAALLAIEAQGLDGRPVPTWQGWVVCTSDDVGEASEESRRELELWEAGDPLRQEAGVETWSVSSWFPR